MMPEPEPLDLRSHDVAGDKMQQLLELFPEARTEGGKIDFDRLRLALGETVDVGKERYGLTWPGKAECFRTIQAPSMGTLLPRPEESINWDTTENLIIEGDNLEVLKLLQKSYLGKIKMIYIDPPYNTGNDFIYPDNYTESLQTYLEYTGQVDAEGKKFGTNTDTDGRFHSKWLNMMYPRLYLARNLLREDGLIFISIDDVEVDNLKKICNEVFGEAQFVEQVVWKNKYGSGAMTRGFANVHEYILCYSKGPLRNLVAPLSDEARLAYKNRDSKYETRGGYITQPLATKSKDPRPNLVYPIEWQGREVWPDKQWTWSRERVEEALRNDEVVFSESSGRVTVRVKQYLRDEAGRERLAKPVSVMNGPFNQDGTREMTELLGEGAFPFPKPSALLRALLSLRNESDDRPREEASEPEIILDLFAGSGTTAQAVLELNASDGGTRRFILVQLPEATGRADHASIADICKARVREVIRKLDQGQSALRPDQDRGFRVFKLAQSNFRMWAARASEDPGALQEKLELHVDHLVAGRTAQDCLSEILLKSGYPPTTPVSEQVIDGRTVYRIADGAMLVCLALDLTLEVIRGMAALGPERTVCLDAGFAGNDQLKANAIQTFRTKGVTSFRTV